MADKNVRECSCIKFASGGRIVADVALRTKNVEITDVQLFVPECFVGGFAFDSSSSRRSILRVNSIVDGFGPERHSIRIVRTRSMMVISRRSATSFYSGVRGFVF